MTQQISTNAVKRAVYRTFVHPIRDLDQKALHLLEGMYAPPFTAQFRNRPIFIIGPPRSGSTLLMQAVVSAFDVGYINNTHCRWYGSPALAKKILSTKGDIDFLSEYGRTMGAGSPAECGSWWYRFFAREPVHATLDNVKPKKMRRFRRSLLALTNAFAKHMIFKNLYAGMRIQAIAEYVPEALFIVNTRNEIDNGHSLLAARQRVLGSYDEWFSIRTPDAEIELFREPAAVQVVEQIRRILAIIESDLDSFDKKRRSVLYTRYEAVCENPRRELHRIEKFLRANDCSLEADFERLPKSFVRDTDISIERSVYKELTDYAGRRSV